MKPTPSSAPVFALGDIVYHKIKPEWKGIVTGRTERQYGFVYGITWADDLREENHFACELTTEKDYSNNDA
jgi:hypothetical protein